MRRRETIRWISWACGTLLALAGSIYAWAALSIDTSAVARALVWREADVEDWKRFPARHINAPADSLPLTGPQDGTQNAILGMSVQGDNETAALSTILEQTETTAFLVLRNDEILAEWYGDGTRADSMLTSFSVAKSILSSLVGIVIAEGSISAVDPITRYVPELLDRNQSFAEITIEDLLTMASGLSYVEGGLPWSDDSVTYYHPNLRQLAIEDVQIESPPGSRFHYNNFNPLLLGIALERATDQPVAGLLESRLWQPLQAEFDASWSLDSDASGFEKMESGFNARARDYARFGMLFAMEGRALDGRQVIPSNWVRVSTMDHTAGSYETDEPYGYYWWLTEETQRPLARGNHGQFILIDSEENLVVVRLGKRFGLESWPALLDHLADRIISGTTDAFVGG